MEHYVSLKNHLHLLRAEMDTLKILLRDGECEHLITALTFAQMKYEIGLRLLTN